MMRAEIRPYGMRIAFLLLTVVGLFLGGCGKSPLYERMDALPERVWETSNVFEYAVDVSDTVSSYDFYLNLRISADYPFSNIYMFVHTVFPDGNTVRDTVECILADPTGRWLGKGLGDILDNRILFKPRVRFPHSGTYRFHLEQGMRMEQLPEVYDVGITIVDSSR